MKCSACRDRLAAYQDSMLSASAVAEVEAHLGSCVGCRAFAEELMVVEHRLARLTEIEPSREFTRLIMARIAAMPAPSRRVAAAAMSLKSPFGTRRVRVWWLGVYDLLAWTVLAALTATGILRWKAIAAEGGALLGKLALSADALYRVADHFHLTTIALAGGLVEGGVLLFLLYAGRRYLAGMRTALFGTQTI